MTTKFHRIMAILLAAALMLGGFPALATEAEDPADAGWITSYPDGTFKQTLIKACYAEQC